MVIKVDFDLAITVVAHYLYRLLALDLRRGHRHLTARCSTSSAAPSP